MILHTHALGHRPDDPAHGATPHRKAAPSRWGWPALALWLALLWLVALLGPARAQALVPASLLGEAVQQVVSGDSHTCALTSAGAVQCWGKNGNGQLGNGTNTQRNTPVPVTGLGSGVALLVAGREHTCALNTAGAVQCWGWNSDGQLGNGTTNSSSTPVPVTGLGSGVASLAAGANHTCAVTTIGAVQCWGNNGNGQLGNGSLNNSRITPVAVIGLGSGVAALAAGTAHTCALTAGGAVQCWGNNGVGQLGNGTTNSSNTPVAVTGRGSGVAALAAGNAHTCVVTSAGAVQCWGWNPQGQLGDGTTTQRTAPVPVNGLGSDVASLAVGANHTCAVTTIGAVQCWGNNGNGQLGNGSLNNSSSPVAVSGLGSGVASLAAGFAHTCALTNAGSVQCWGNNGYGQLGNDPTTDSRTPVPVSGLGSRVVALAGGFGHTCALTAASSAQCWGYNSVGQLGDGSTTDHGTPEPVAGLGSGVAALASGNVHTCALTRDGAVQCWGNNNGGQLGDGTTSKRPTPAPVSGLDSGVVALAAGQLHTCALNRAGAVMCWGANGYGQLGDGTTSSRLTPEPVSGLGSGVVALAADSNHTCAVTSSGSVMCWGRNDNRQLGDGSTANRAFPVQVSGLGGNVVSVTAGQGHSCALTDAGAVQCWGWNAFGQLGNGTTAEQLTPVPVLGLDSGVVALTAGDIHTCALTSAGAAQCWGGNNFGQLGDGTGSRRSAPVPVSGLGSDVVALATGTGHTCALTSAGALLCWGYNFYGQLGDGTLAQRNSPTHISASQAIAFTAATPLRAGAFSALTGTASSGLVVDFDTWTPDVCSVAGSIVSALPGQSGSLCGVRALQAGGTGVGSAQFVAAPVRSQLLVVQAGTPSSPAGLQVVAGDSAASVTWTAPVSDNGSPVTGYVVSASPAQAGLPVRTCTAIPPGTECVVSGLANGTGYVFTVTATNALGESAASASALATPQVIANPAVALPGGGNAAVRISGAPPGCALVPGSLTVNGSPPPGAPAGTTFPKGVLRFEAAGCTAATLTVAITYPTPLEPATVLRKYGRQSASASTDTWFTPTGAAISGDRLTATFTVTDNGEGDNDPTPGIIRDPFAPTLMAAVAVPSNVAAIPTLSQWSLILMSVLAAGVGVLAARRRAGTLA
ncbi:MAG: IPTL-CTERM sorting domain-containing protein [Hyphomicrobiales bacterium]|nr:MAG: IPTL-CTERM sorting domain-containing protein [Hyphomicrobiales bacterium]